MALYKGITKLPLEVYPLIFMMSCAVGFGTFVAGRKIGFDQDLRIHNNYKHEDWTMRLRNSRPSDAHASN